MGGGLMNTLRTIAASALLAAITNLSPLLAQTQPPRPAASCAPTNGLNFVCGAQNPEDLVPVPGTRWLIASGMTAGAGLKLVDTDSKTVRACLLVRERVVWLARQDSNLQPAV